jgi:hypothetical protein
MAMFADDTGVMAIEGTVECSIKSLSAQENANKTQ